MVGSPDPAFLVELLTRKLQKPRGLLPSLTKKFYIKSTPQEINIAVHLNEHTL